MKGITAIQMDIKIKGIDRDDPAPGAGAGAAKAVCTSWARCSKCCPRRATELSPYAPKIVHFTINPEKIREVIGPGGKMINKIIAETGVKIDIEDDGRVFIATPDEDAAAKARQHHRRHRQGY